MTTVVEAKSNKLKEVLLSDKAQKWCRRVAGIAARRAFRVKDLEHMTKSFDPDKVQFYLLPKIFHRKRISHTDSETKIFLLPEFFDEKGNIRKKLSKELRNELKAAIYKEVTHFAVKRYNRDFYKIMLRCTWEGPRVEGAPGSPNEARKVLEQKKQVKKTNKRKIKEIPTGQKEDVEMFDLRSGKKVLVKDADIFLTEKGSIKIARGVFEGRNLRTMRPGGSELRKKLNL